MYAVIGNESKQTTAGRQLRVVAVKISPVCTTCIGKNKWGVVDADTQQGSLEELFPTHLPVIGTKRGGTVHFAFSREGIHKTHHSLVGSVEHACAGKQVQQDQNAEGYEDKAYERQQVVAGAGAGFEPEQQQWTHDGHEDGLSALGRANDDDGGDDEYDIFPAFLKKMQVKMKQHHQRGHHSQHVHIDERVVTLMKELFMRIESSDMERMRPTP